MDEIEAVGCKGPFPLRVIELESTVWRDPTWLDVGEVGTNHLGRGKLVGKVAAELQQGIMREQKEQILHCPYPRSSSNVKHFLSQESVGFVLFRQAGGPAGIAICVTWGLGLIGAKKSLLSRSIVHM